MKSVYFGLALLAITATTASAQSENHSEEPAYTGHFTFASEEDSTDSDLEAAITSNVGGVESKQFSYNSSEELYLKIFSAIMNNDD